MRLADLQGLIVGGFTEVRDNDIPFGQTAEEIIMAVAGRYNYPICFDFPAGHIPGNCSIILGRTVNLSVNKSHVTVDFG